jgi:hypothetical protein
MTCDHKAHRGRTAALAQADTEWRGCTYDREPLFVLAAFTLRPKCKMCGDERFRWEYRKTVQAGPAQMFGDPPYDSLRLTCDRCGWQFNMQTKSEGER